MGDKSFTIILVFYNDAAQQEMFSLTQLKLNLKLQRFREKIKTRKQKYQIL